MTESKYEKSLKRRNKILAITIIIIIGFSGLMTYLATDGFVNNPITGEPFTGTSPPTNITIVGGQGIKIAGTGIYANDTPITAQTLYGLNADGEAVLIATVTNGVFISNPGPEEGGTFDLYISISGCILYVGQCTVPSAESYEQVSVNIGVVKVYTSATTYSVQLIGATSNTFTSGGSAGTTNYTQSANVEQSYTLMITNTHDYSILYRDYTDPRDGIVIEPVLWIEITTTNAYTNTAGVKAWDDSTKSYFLVPISSITCPGTTDVALTFTFNLVLPTAGTYAFAAYICDGSSMERLETAGTRVADPLSGETITNTQIVGAYVIVS